MALQLQQLKPEITLEQCAAQFVHDPLGFVCFAYPWGQPGVLADASGPDAWQVDVLETVRRALQNPDHAGAIRLAVASGHGIGKGTLTAWLVQWFLATRPYPQIVVTANTKAQLETKTWRELAKWHFLSRFQSWFTWTKTLYYLTRAPDTWFAAAIPWNEHKAEAFSGTHERYVLMIADEASILPNAICDAIEGSLTTPQAICCLFGNPTRTTGRFREVFPGGRFAHRWQTMQVDSRTAKMADQAQIAEWISDYGEDSDFVRVRVKGLFPRQAVGQFISEETTLQALARVHVHDPLQPTVIGVDVARYGDDRSVIVVRQGARLTETRVYREIDTVRLSGYVCEVLETYRSHHPVCCIDAVGIGAGVVDVCRARGFSVEEIVGGMKPQEPARYFNKVAECWDQMRLWLETRACLDAVRDKDLAAEVTQREYDYTLQGQLRMEQKGDMKRRGLASPDLCDAVALTFAVPVAPKTMPARPAVQPVAGLDPRTAWMS